MELFEEVVLTVLMMYIGYKKAVALLKKIQENAAVIASRWEIEEKSRSLEEIKSHSSTNVEAAKHSESRHQNVVHVEAPSPKISKVDISWPKDIIEDESHLRILRNRTPSVSEIEEVELFEDKATLLEKRKVLKVNNSIEEICDETEEVVEGIHGVITKVSYEINGINKSSESKKEFFSECAKIDCKSEEAVVSGKDPAVSSETLNGCENDIVSNNIDESLPTCKIFTNGSAKESIIKINETIDASTNDQKQSIVSGDVPNDNSEPVSDFKTAVDVSITSTSSSDTIANVSSSVDSIEHLSDRVKNADLVDKSKTSNESLKTMRTKSVDDNTVYLCAAKYTEESSVDSHLKLCGNGVVVGNSDLGQKVQGSTDEEDSEIFYSAACELEKPFWLIFSGEYTKAMNKDWHSGHFCCWQCDESLTGQRYVLRDDHPYCIKCYESVFANPCEECGKIIGIDSKDLSYKDKHWHEACFLCNKCHVSLVDKQFGSKADKIYCGSCYDTQFASRCDGCSQIFRAGTKKMEYKTRQWHEQCFCCCVCKSAIGTKSFIPREQEIYCATCYEEKFATRCVKCNKIITSGGVTYKNEPWHRECFTCTNCSASLAGQRFTSRDEKPYCADCFGELFAKRCTSCSKPITGIGGTRFISFEDRHWHNDCFVCASCKTSLVGRGFITDADDIICPDCAKAKLM